MANHYIHVGSITNAMRGKRLLESEGMQAYLKRSTNGTSGDGCGYSLLITGDEERAGRILAKGKVKVIRISDAM